MERWTPYTILSETPSLPRQKVIFAIEDGVVRWIQWDDLNQERDLTHFAVIFNQFGDNKWAPLVSPRNMMPRLILATSQQTPNIYGIAVANGSFQFDENGIIYAQTMGDPRNMLSIILPGFIRYIDNEQIYLPSDYV